MQKGNYSRTAIMALVTVLLFSSCKKDVAQPAKPDYRDAVQGTYSVVYHRRVYNTTTSAYEVDTTYTRTLSVVNNTSDAGMVNVDGYAMLLDPNNYTMTDPYHSMTSPGRSGLFTHVNTSNDSIHYEVDNMVLQYHYFDTYDGIRQ